MRRPAAQVACPAEGKLDQRLPARRFAKHRPQNDVGKHNVHDHMHEPPQHARGIVDQRVMHIGPPIKEGAGLAAQFGHQVFVDVVRPVEIPHQHRGDGIQRDGQRHQHQRQAPDFDIIAQEYHHGDTHDQHQPNARVGGTFRVFNGVRHRQTVFFGKGDFRLQRFRNHTRAFTSELVNDTDRVDFNQIGDRNHQGADHKRHIHKQSKGPPRRTRPRPPHGVL